MPYVNISLQVDLRLFSTNFTWSILEYFAPNKELSELINIFWQQKKPLDELKDKMGTYDVPKTAKNLEFLEFGIST